MQTSHRELGRTQIPMMLQHLDSDNGVYIPVAGQCSEATSEHEQHGEFTPTHFACITFSFPP